MDNFISILILGALVVLMFLMLRRSKAGDSELAVQLSQLIKERLDENKDATKSVQGQVESFTKGMAELRGRVEQVQESVKDVVSFQDIFKSPKLRGNWGETSLDSSLSQYFGKGQYETQHYFKSGEAVDAVLKLPDGLFLPIDSKFNWENFEKMIRAENDEERKKYKKQFFLDVRKKIDEIAGKYILPSEDTTDFALMYVPAETIYYELINNIENDDISKYARSKKVILVSPNTFYLTISVVYQWFKNVEFGKQTKEIMKRLERISADGGKLAEEFRVLGKHINNAQGAFDSTERRLDLMVDRVDKVIEIGDSESDDQLVIESPVKDDEK